MNFLASAAPYLQIALGGYECLVWGLNLKPYTFHPVNMSWVQRSMAIAVRSIRRASSFDFGLTRRLKRMKQINGMPHLIHGALQLKRGPRALDTAVYLGGLSFFTNIQTYFWWLPYFFNIISEPRALEFTEKLDDLATWLPERFTDSLVPDVEHTVLFPLSLITLVSTAAAFVQTSRASSRHSAIAIMSGFALAALPGAQIILQNKGFPAEDRRGLGIAVTNSLLFTSAIALINLWAKSD
jgi:hypothetical protein